MSMLLFCCTRDGIWRLRYHSENTLPSLLKILDQSVIHAGLNCRL